MSEEYASIFQVPTQEQLRPMYDWLDKNVSTMNGGWRSKSPEPMCAQVTFDQRKHKRMFDFYAELQGIAVYDTLKEYQTAQIKKWQGNVNWMDDV